VRPWPNSCVRADTGGDAATALRQFLDVTAFAVSGADLVSLRFLVMREGLSSDPSLRRGSLSSAKAFSFSTGSSGFSSPSVIGNSAVANLTRGGVKHGALADNVDLGSNCGASARKADLAPDGASGALHPGLSRTIGAGLTSSTPGPSGHDGVGTDVALTAFQPGQGRGAEAVAPLAGGWPPRGLMIAWGRRPQPQWRRPAGRWQ